MSPSDGDLDGRGRAPTPAHGAPDDGPPDGRPEVPPDLALAFTPRQVGGFILVAALVIGVARWLRARRRAPRGG